MTKEHQTQKERKQSKQRRSSIIKENTMSFGLTQSTFDWDGLLHRLMGDEDLAKEIIGDFIEQIPDRLHAVKKALNNQNLLLIHREAHIIKGASGNVGALTLQEIAQQIEIASEAKDLVKAGSFIAKLDTQFEILKNKLAQSKQ